MSIEYWVIENKLTVPVSYRALPQAISVLQLEDMAERINLNIPNIPEATAKTCLELLALIVKQELLNGNTVNLTNFLSFVVTIPVRLPLADVALPPNMARPVMKPSPVFTAEVAALATYRRLGVIVKEPIIVSAADATTGLQNWMREGFMLNINGSNLNFNPNDQTQGLFFSSPAGNTLRAADIAWLTDKTVMAIPEIDPTEGPAGAGSVEYGLQIRARYTPTGTLKTGRFDLLRKTNVIGVNNVELFVKGSASSGPAIVSGYDGDPITARIVAQIRPDNMLTISTGTLEGDLGQATVITGNGTYTISGDVSIEIQVVDYSTLYDNVIQCQRYLLEVAEINTLAIGWRTDNPTTITATLTTTVYIKNGELPITWTIESGHGYHFVNNQTTIIGGRSVVVYSDAESCGNVIISASDSLTTAEGVLTQTNPTVKNITWNTFQNSVNPGENPIIIVNGGYDGYFEWSTSSPDLTVEQAVTTTRQNRLIASSDVCADQNVIVSVTDGCANLQGGISLNKSPIQSWNTAPDYLMNSVQKTMFRVSGGLQVRQWSASGDGAVYVSFVDISPDTRTAYVVVNRPIPGWLSVSIIADDGCHPITKGVSIQP